MRTDLGKFLTSEDGVTSIEYGLIAGTIAVMLVTGLATLGTNLTHAFATIAVALG